MIYTMSPEEIREQAEKIVEAECIQYSPVQDEPCESALEPGPNVCRFDSAFVLKCLSRNQIGDADIFQTIHRGRYLYDHSAGAWFKWAGAVPKRKTRFQVRTEAGFRTMNL